MSRAQKILFRIKRRLRKNIKLPIVFVIGVLLCFYPYVFSSVFHLGSETLVLLVTFLITFVWVVKSKGLFPISVLLCIIIQAAVWLAYVLIHADTSYVARVFFICYASLLLMLLLKKRLFIRFINTYNWFIALQALLGVPVFFLYALGLLSPLAEFQNIDGRPLYFFGVTFSNMVMAGITRVAGFFDEPGALASWGIFALVFNKLTVNNRKMEIILMVSLLFTLSAAYFIQLALYVFFFYGTKAKTMISAALILGIVGLFTFRYLGDNEQLRYLTVERFQGGTIRSSRNEMTVDAMKVFQESPIIGIGARALQERGYMDDNPFEIPAKDGIVGLLITYLPILMVVFNKKCNNRMLLGALVLAAGYLQRPFHVNLLHYVMLYSFYLLRYYNKANEFILRKAQGVGRNRLL